MGGTVEVTDSNLNEMLVVVTTWLAQTVSVAVAMLVFVAPSKFVRASVYSRQQNL